MHEIQKPQETPPQQKTPQQMATNYMFRQHVMMWKVTVLCVTLAMLYTIWAGRMVPFLELGFFNLVAVMIGNFWFMKKLNEGFAMHVRNMQLGKPTDWRLITVPAWTVYAFGVILLYWVAAILWVSYFMELPPPVPDYVPEHR